MSHPDKDPYSLAYIAKAKAWLAMGMLGFTLPTELLIDIRNGRYFFKNRERDRLCNLLVCAGTLRPMLLSYGEILSEHRLWTSPSAKFYLGGKSESAVPGDVDPTKVVIIGEVEPDMPIALDFRTQIPSVLYYGTLACENYWFRLASDYPSLIANIRSE